MTGDEPPSKTKIEDQKGSAADRFLQQPLVQVSIRQSPTRRVAGMEAVMEERLGNTSRGQQQDLVQTVTRERAFE
jgi:hypothetical protein